MPTGKGRQMKPDTIAVLIAATVWQRDRGDTCEWFKPRELAAPCPPVQHLLSLERRGFIEKRQASAPDAWREKKLWEYRLTPAGLVQGYSLALDARLVA